MTEAPKINFEDMPVWTVKRAAAYLNVSRMRLFGWLVKGVPEGAPALVGEKDESKRFYLDAASVKAFGEFMKANPAIASRGGGGPRGDTRKYAAYITDAQATEIKGLYPGIRLEIANRSKAKPKAVPSA